MRARDFIFETPSTSAMQKDVLNKIQNIPVQKGQSKKAQALFARLLRTIEQFGVGGRLQSLTKGIEGVNDLDVQKALEKVVKVVAGVDLSPKAEKQLMKDWKNDNLVSINKLTSTTSMYNEVFKDYDKGGYMTELVDDLATQVNYGVGPGEFLLAVLSKNITGMGATSAKGDNGETLKGDLLIDGKNVELKTANESPARFVDREVTFSTNYLNLVHEFYATYREEIKAVNAPVSGINQSKLSKLLQLNPGAAKDVALIINNIFTALPDSVGELITNLLANGKIPEAQQKIAQANVENYLEIKKNLSGILFMDLKNKRFNFLRKGVLFPTRANSSPEEQSGVFYRLHASTSYLIAKSEKPFSNVKAIITKK